MLPSPARKPAAKNLLKGSDPLWQNARQEPAAALHVESQGAMRQERQHQAGAFAMQRQSRLMGQAMKMCGDSDEAEDLVQEVILRFIEEFSTRDMLPQAPTCEAWLVRTLSNLFFGQCRRLRIQVKGARDPALSPEAREAAPAPTYENITSEQFAEALSSLSAKIRGTWELRAAGKKYEEIAELLQIPVGTVKKRLHGARTKLREYLQTFLTPGEP